MNVKYTTFVNINTIGLLVSHNVYESTYVYINVNIALTLDLIFPCALTYDASTCTIKYTISQICVIKDVPVASEQIF